MNGIHRKGRQTQKMKVSTGNPRTADTSPDRRLSRFAYPAGAEIRIREPRSIHHLTGSLPFIRTRTEFVKEKEGPTCRFLQRCISTGTHLPYLLATPAETRTPGLCDALNTTSWFRPAVQYSLPRGKKEVQGVAKSKAVIVWKAFHAGRCDTEDKGGF